MLIGVTSAFSDALGEFVHRAFGAGAGGQGHELVAAEPGDHLAGRGRQDWSWSATSHQQPVAGRVAEAVVDGLEAVQVQVAQAEALALARVEGLLQPFGRTGSGWAGR